MIKCYKLRKAALWKIADNKEEKEEEEGSNKLHVVESLIIALVKDA